MNMPLKDCFSLCLTLYFIHFFFSFISLIPKCLNTSKKSESATIPRNFLWRWLTLILSIALVFFLIFSLHKNDNQDINIILVLTLVTIPLILGETITFLWKFHGPVIIVSNQEVSIKPYKFLYRLSRFYSFNYDSFVCTYSEPFDFVSNFLEDIFFEIQFDDNTINQLYQKFVFQIILKDVNFTNKNIQIHLENKIEDIFKEVWIKHQSTLETINLDEDQNKKILLSIEQDFVELLKNNYQIDAVITKLSFERISKNLDKEIIV